MPGKAKSGSTTTAGPSWTDIAALMREIEAIHSCTLVLNVKPDGSRFGGSVAVECKVARPVLVGLARAYSLTTHSLWPSQTAKSFEGLVYGLLLHTDHRLATGSYEQATMTFPPADE
jgi:hypothetical protein